MRIPLLRRPARPAPPSGLPGPDALEVNPRHLQAGQTLCRTLMVTGYPAEVGPAWLEPLTSGPVDVAVHIDPVPSAVAADRLRRQRARLESSRRLGHQHGHLADYAAEAAAEDADELAQRLARGQGRLYRVGLYVTVRGRTLEELDAETARVHSLLASMLIDAHPATFRHLQGWTTTLPLGLDRLGAHRTLDTRALAASFPFASAELPTPDSGVLIGRNPATSGLVSWDRFAQPNYNTVILARSGAGKSYLAKLEALRWLYQGVQVAIIDPEDEYRGLADAIGGSYLHLGAPGVRLNPFDLDRQPDALTRRALHTHTLLAVLLGRALDPPTRAAVDRAVLAAYATRGITTDPRTHARPAPLLADLVAALTADPDLNAHNLAAQLAPHTVGTHRGLWDGPTTTHPTGHLVVFSLRDLPEELKPAGTLLTMDTIWRQVTDPTHRTRRLVIVDEAWLLARDPAGARFLARLAKSARKHACGLTTVTQDAADLLASDLGQKVVANAATQILLGQAPQTMTSLARAFGLTEGERAFLLTAQVGQGILAAGTQRVAFHAHASPAEHALIESPAPDPAEPAAQEAQAW